MATSNRSKRAKKTQNALETIQENTDAKMKKLYPPIIQEVLDKGDWDKVGPEVNEIFKELGYRGDVRTATLQGNVDGTLVGLDGALNITDVGELEDYYLKTNYTAGNLSNRLYRNANAAQSTVTQIVKEHIKFNTNWKSLSSELRKSTNTVGDVANIIKRVELQGQKYISGKLTPTQVKEFRSLVRRANGYVDGLAKGDAPTKQLKNAYNKVIGAVDSNDSKLLKNALANAFDKKISYLNDTLSRSELARSYGMSFHRRIEDDEDIIGYRILLSPDHPKADQCDLITNANNGCGNGVYKKGDGPTVPIHPNCLCMMEPYADIGQECSLKRYSNTSARKYLNSIDDKKRESILGVGNASSKSNWDQGLKSKRIDKSSWKKLNMLPQDQVTPVETN